MGQSLTLYFPVAREVSTKEPLFAADRLHLTLDDGARPFVQAWTVWDLPAGLIAPGECFEDSGCTRPTCTDAYGHLLTWTTGAEIRRHHSPPPDLVLPWTYAVFSFLSWLPPEQIVVLYWD